MCNRVYGIPTISPTEHYTASRNSACQGLTTMSEVSEVPPPALPRQLLFFQLSTSRSFFGAYSRDLQHQKTFPCTFLRRLFHQIAPDADECLCQNWRESKNTFCFDIRQCPLRLMLPSTPRYVQSRSRYWTYQLVSCKNPDQHMAKRDVEKTER